MDSIFLSIILPAHNEEKRLPIAIEKLQKYLIDKKYNSEIIVVENGSTDDTYNIAIDIAKKYKNIIVIQEEKSGKGRAVKCGMLNAKGKYRIYCDVDFSMPVEQIDKFTDDNLKNYDIIIASREGLNSKRYGEPKIRYITGRLFNTFVKALILPGINDSQCGFKCFQEYTIENIFNKQLMMGWSFDVELLLIAKKYNYKIIEIGIPWYYNGDSKIKIIKDGLKMSMDILKIWRNSIYGIYNK
jgi:dolichyl-phosphate beta-glucosyltransferase